MRHEDAAAELADKYEHGDEQTRSWVARTCEEQGVLAALVARSLRDRGLDESFVEAMKRGLPRGRAR